MSEFTTSLPSKRYAQHYDQQQPRYYGAAAMATSDRKIFGRKYRCTYLLLSLVTASDAQSSLEFEQAHAVISTEWLAPKPFPTVMSIGVS